MKTPKRKNNPELIRASFINEAKSLAQTKGISSISIPSICELVGATKGAFFHHFSNKDALIECVFKSMVDDFSEQITALIKDDPQEFGAFTRAYLNIGISTFQNDHMLSMWTSAMADQKVCNIWRDWLLTTLENRGGLENSPSLEIVRFATDGLCMGASIDISPNNLEGTINELRKLCQ